MSAVSLAYQDGHLHIATMLMEAGAEKTIPREVCIYMYMARCSTFATVRSCDKCIVLRYFHHAVL